MKKVIVVLMFCLIQSLLHAQSPISKGSISLGGSISYTSQSYENSEYTHSTFIFNPKVGYFFIDNFYTALSLSYVHLKSGSGSDSDAYGIGPSIRYYFEAGKIKPFIGVGYNYITQSNIADDGNYITNEFIISTGMDFFIVDALALETSVNYSFTSYKFSGSRLPPQDSKVFRLDIGLIYFIF